MSVREYFSRISWHELVTTRHVPNPNQIRGFGGESVRIRIRSSSDIMGFGFAGIFGAAIRKCDKTVMGVVDVLFHIDLRNFRSAGTA